MKKLIIAFMLVAIASMSPVMAQNKPQAIIAVDAGPGMLKALEGVQFQGKFKSVDPKTRKVVIVGPEGRELEAILGDEVKNFDKIKVGDIVTLSILKVIVSDVKVISNGIKERAETLTYSRAQAGDKPAGIIEHQVKLVADVTAIDANKNIVTLKGPTKTVQVAVGQDILKGIKVGNQIEAIITQNIAVQVTAPPVK
jgi:ASC-1-like (ASCH) protein